MKVQIDLQELNDAFRDALPGAKSEAKAAMAEASMDFGGSPLFDNIDLDDIKDDICEAWPDVLKAAKWLSWIPFIGKYAAIVQAAIQALDKAVMSKVCSTS